MRELYRCSMMPGMPAEPVSDSRLSAQDVMPVCGTCQNAGGMAAGDKELLMRQIMEVCNCEDLRNSYCSFIIERRFFHGIQRS